MIISQFSHISYQLKTKIHPFSNVCEKCSFIADDVNIQALWVLGGGLNLTSSLPRATIVAKLGHPFISIYSNRESQGESKGIP